MNNQFNGAAKFSAADVISAVSAYKQETKFLEGLIQSHVEIAEENFQPTVWGKLRGRKKLHDCYRAWLEGCSWRSGSYTGWLNLKGMMQFSKESKTRIQKHSCYKVNCEWFDIWQEDTLCEQVRKLGYGSEVYLNPQQAGFVNYWSKE